MALISTDRVETNRVKLEVSIAADVFSKGVETAYRKAVKNINIPGFRKGKAPRSLIEKMYGKEVFFEDAVNDLYPDALSSAIDESGLRVIKDGIELDVQKVSLEDGVVFTAVVTTYPEAKISGYKGLEATKKLVVVAESQVDEEIDRVRDRNSRIETAERAAENGDIAVFDFDGYCDGKAFEGGKAENFSLLLGSGQFIPGFEEQLVGHSAGEEFDVNVTFPEDYHAEELKGKAAVFKIKMHEVKVKELPELDDEFVKDVSEFDTVDEYKADIRANILKRAEEEADNEVAYKLQESLIDLIDADIPTAMFDAKCEELVYDMDNRLRAQGLTLDKYMQYANTDYDTLVESFRPRAEEAVKLRLALETIAKQEGYEVTDEDLEAEYNKIAEMIKRDIDFVKGAINVEDLKGDIMADKAFKFVKENANITEGE